MTSPAEQPSDRPTPEVVSASAGDISQGSAVDRSTANLQAPDPELFANLRLLAECYEDVQRTRIGLENRLRRADAGDTAKLAMAAPLESFKAAEKALSLPMKRALRAACPDAAAWAKNTPGMGEHLAARLIGVIGHPVIAQPYHWEGEGAKRHLVPDPPFRRNVAKLWAYCGHGDPGRKKRKGMTAEEAFALGSPRAKMLVHLLAVSAMKCVGSEALALAASNARPPLADTDLSGGQGICGTQGGPASADPSTDAEAMEESRPSEPTPRRRSPFRDTYDLARYRYADREDWTDGHRHAAALRVTGKAILLDLWKACS